MSRQGPARRLVFALFALSGALAPASFAGADPPAANTALFATGPHGERWSRALEARLGPFDPDPVASAAAAPDRIARERMDALAGVEAQLLAARRQAASLREREALASLAAAERTIDALADVPGASAWAAEVQLQLGAVAAQAGMLELARSAFRRAATLEPGRRLLPAEAAPEVVALCDRIHGERAAAPTGSFVVEVAQPAAVRARVFLDDVAQGTTPAAVRAIAGRHLLRVEAAGHRSYGSFIDVLSGQRPVLAVQLTPTPRLELARALERAARAGELAGLVDGLRAAHARGEHAIASALWVETAVPAARALIVYCDRDGCRGPTRARAGAPIALVSSAADAAKLSSARTWLSRPARESEAAPPLWKRWYVWGGTALAVAAGSVALGLALQPEPERRLQVEVIPLE